MKNSLMIGLFIGVVCVLAVGFSPSDKYRYEIFSTQGDLYILDSHTGEVKMVIDHRTEKHQLGKVYNMMYSKPK